ncbi:MAG: tRNA threonylcarbamoyladenosine biosynthesis protein TsaE [Planctomycetota bacterium]|jgi:tRNA threonylcarbamoyladenosine biosynthesis protein TsaE
MINVEVQPGRLIRDEDQMRALGSRLIAGCKLGGVITLKGDLGTGKTTLVRGALQAMGISSGVRSPTYTLVEYYPFDQISVAHFDLYRLADGEELEYLGFRDYLNEQTLCLIEWPERAGGYLHEIDLEIRLQYDAEGRRVEWEAFSEVGTRLAGLIND